MEVTLLEKHQSSICPYCAATIASLPEKNWLTAARKSSFVWKHKLWTGTGLVVKGVGFRVGSLDVGDRVGFGLVGASVLDPVGAGVGFRLTSGDVEAGLSTGVVGASVFELSVLDPVGPVVVKNCKGTGVGLFVGNGGASMLRQSLR